MTQPTFEFSTKGNKATFILSGILSQQENNGTEFLKAFREAEKKYKEITIHVVNLFGGSIDEGNVIARVIRQSKSKTITITEGLSASMGVPISLAGNHKRYMIKRSRLMLHRATLMMQGNADQMRENAKMVEQMEQDLAEDIGAIIGKEPDFVKENYFNKGDTYLSATEAKKLGFVNDVIDGDLTEDLPTNMLENPVLENIASFYANQLKPKSNEMEKLPLMVANLKVANPEFAGDTQEAVVAEVQAQANELVQARAKVTELTDKVQAAEDAKAVSMVESFKEKLSLSKEQVDNYTKFAKTDFNSCKATLEAAAPHVPASQRIKKDGEENEQYKGWDFTKFQLEAPKELARMKAEEPEDYKALFKAKFGSEPRM